jgi:CO/xanthine dehydrogenase FAD-binding subunit
MLNLREIRKPKTIEDALKLLQQPDTVVLAGGTELIARRRKDVRAVVDLSGLGLAYIRDQNGAVAIGAMTTLADVADSPMLRAVANGIVAQAAHRSAASLLRNQATVAGTLIAEPDGLLAGALGVLDALVQPSPPAPLPTGEGGIALVEFLARREELLRGAIVTEVVIPAEALGRRAVVETVARTPRDKPIVSVTVSVERISPVVGARIVLGRVAEVVTRAVEAERELEGKELDEGVIEDAARAAMANVNSRGDFRGSAEYRREMVGVLVRRALSKIASRQ